MVKLSACLIVKNEEQFIANCLNSLKDLANEIVIADTGSTDKTKDIINDFKKTFPNLKLHDFKWIKFNFSLTLL